VVQNQPKFKARIGYRESNIVLACSFNSIFETGMISRPFYIKDAPELVYLTILIDSPAAGIYSQGN